jgi:hemerythrin-like domain-containing protein
MSTVEQARPDTHEMVIVHRAFRREFRLAPELIRGVAAGDTVRARVVADHVADLVWGLHHHHHGEDELLWPKLLERAKPSTELIELMEALHARVSAALDGVDALIEPWRANAEPEAGATLAAAINDMTAALTEHLDQEEREILPLTEQHLSVAEWQQLGKNAVDSLPKSKRLTFLGLILEDTTDEERAEFLAHIPAPVRVLWRLVGVRGYAKYVARVRG